MEFREPGLHERPKVNEFYQLTTYRRPVSVEDRVFVAENGGAVLGAVRIEKKDGEQVLRGMYMHPRQVRAGIGSRLLSYIEPSVAIMHRSAD